MRYVEVCGEQLSMLTVGFDRIYKKLVLTRVELTAFCRFVHHAQKHFDLVDTEFTHLNTLSQCFVDRPARLRVELLVYLFLGHTGERQSEHEARVCRDVISRVEAPMLPT